MSVTLVPAHAREVQQEETAGIMVAPLFAVLLALSELVAPAFSRAEQFCEPGQRPVFLADFAALKAELGPTMGEPVECEHTSPETGASRQRTTTGFAYRSRDTSWPSFTNGHDHWALTPGGVVHSTGWHASSPPDPERAAPDDPEGQAQGPPVPVASIETVTIVQAPDATSGTLIIRRQGNLYRIATAPGCPGPAPSNGQVAFIRSRGAFAAAGSELILSVGDPGCPISGNEPL